MGYSRKTYITPVGKYVEEYHTGRNCPKGGKRGPKKVRTPEEIQKNNQRIKERNIQLLLMNNFMENDYFATLTYRKENRPSDMKEAKEDMAKAIRVIRREYQKAGEELKWICNIEKGSRGGWHIHLAINRIQDTDIILAKAWRDIHGGVHTTLLYEQGGFRKLANYFAKRQQDEDKEDKQESGYSRSRNLEMPKVEKKEIKRWDTWKESIREPKGYVLDKESVEEGYTRMGYPYRRYLLMAQEGRRRNGSPPVRGGVKRSAQKVPKKGGLRAGSRRKGRKASGDDHGSHQN